MEQYIIPLLRFLIIFPLLHLVTSLMGKRSIGELPVVDFIVVITIGNVVGADLADPTIHHGPTLMVVILIGSAQFGVTWLKAKSTTFRNLSTMTPTVVMEKGKFLTHNLANIRYTVNDILPLLRQQGVFNPSEIDLAVIEPTGHLSVLKKAPARPVTLQDMGRTPAPEQLPQLLIADGKLVPNALKHGDKDREWLERQLKNLGYQGVEEVYLAAVESDGTLYVSPMDQEGLGPSIHH